MLTHPTHERLIALGLTGMARRWKNNDDSQTSARSTSKSGSL